MSERQSQWGHQIRTWRQMSKQNMQEKTDAQQQDHTDNLYW